MITYKWSHICTIVCGDLYRGAREQKDILCAFPCNSMIFVYILRSFLRPVCSLIDSLWGKYSSYIIGNQLRMVPLPPFI